MSNTQSCAGFLKRTYSGPGELASDLIFPLRHAGRIIRLHRHGLISHSFRERLMIAVTAVNRCRYCTYVHAREALRAGLSTSEVLQLFSGSPDDSPEEERAALLYANHWVESNRRPDPEATQELQRVYGYERAQAVMLTLRLIHAGNLAGNTFDYLLFRISGGRLGGMLPPSG